MCIRDRDITGDEVSDVADIVRNSDKDSVVLTVHREGAEDAMEITVPVTDVELPSVFHEMLDSKIGYIRITQFTGVTGEQYQEAFDDLQKQGMEKMIVDLRDNPGGLLDSVCDILRKIPVSYTHLAAFILQKEFLRIRSNETISTNMQCD